MRSPSVLYRVLARASIAALIVVTCQAQHLRSGQVAIDLEGPQAPFDGALGCGDLDGDAHADLIFARTAGLRVYWGPDYMAGNGSSHVPGQLQRAPLAYAYSGGPLPGAITSVIVADANGDGHRDLLIAARGDAQSCGRVLVLLRDAAGSVVSEHVILPPGASPAQWVGSVVAADFDLDGAVEIVLGGFYDPVGDTLHGPAGPPCPQPGGRTTGLWIRREIELVEYDPATGLFSKRRLITVNAGVWGDPNLPGYPGSLMAYGAALAVGDFNGDGFPDLAVGDPGASDRVGSSYRSAFNAQPYHPAPRYPGSCVPQCGMLDLFLGQPAGPTGASGTLAHDAWLDGWDLENRCVTQTSLTIQAARYASALAFRDLDGDGDEELLVTAPGWRADWGGNAANAYDGQGAPAPAGVDGRLGVLSHPIRKPSCSSTPPLLWIGVGTLYRPTGNYPVQEVLLPQGSYHSESVGVSLATGTFGVRSTAAREAVAVLGCPYLGLDPLQPQSWDRKGEISVLYDVNISAGVRNATASWYHVLAPEQAGRDEPTLFGRWLAAANVNASPRGALDPSPDELICSAPGLSVDASSSYVGAAHVLYQGDPVHRFGTAPAGSSPIPSMSHSMSSSGFGEHILFSSGPALLNGSLDVAAVTLRANHLGSSAWPPACWPLGWLGDPYGQLWWAAVVPAMMENRLLSIWPVRTRYQSAYWNLPWDPNLIGSRFTLYLEVFDLLGGASGGCLAQRKLMSNFLHLTLGS